jgi:adenosylcobinamide kinase/adenosylcobinamide-phosphate guanylyltransferase
MNYFISGGCKNGKSHYAQQIAQSMAKELNLPLYYLATMIPSDHEDIARIKRHLAERKGWGFETIEQGTNILECLKSKTVSGLEVNPKGIFLLDSVTALLSNEMFTTGKDIDMTAAVRVAKDLSDFAMATGNTVFVSDYIYSDAAIYDTFTEHYRLGLAHIDKTLAKLCHKVIEVSYGFIKEHK